MDLTEIKKNYIAKQDEVKKVQNKIFEREKQIERLTNKKYKLQDSAWWGDCLIRPIMELVKVKFPQLIWDDKRLVPMGLGCRVSIFAHIEGIEECVAYLVFSPGDVRNGGIFYDTGEKKPNYPNGSIGQLNGFDNICKEVETIEEIFEYIEKQLIVKTSK